MTLFFISYVSNVTIWLLAPLLPLFNYFLTISCSVLTQLYVVRFYIELYRKFVHQEVLFAPLLQQSNTVIKLLINISSHIDHNNIYI